MIGRDKLLAQLQKRSYTIAEVRNIFKIESYVFRYWESKFRELKPQREKNGWRIYQKSDILILWEIIDLLYNKKFTITGARVALKSKAKQNKKYNKDQINIKNMIAELEGILLELKDYH